MQTQTQPSNNKPPINSPHHTVKPVIEAFLGVALLVTDAVLEQLPAVFAVDGLRAVLPRPHPERTLQPIKMTTLGVAFLLKTKQIFFMKI